MVECECDYICTFTTDKDVLIDTWWNVNEECNLLYNNRKSVLIDTWWNVNEDYLDTLDNIETF